ncbi:hypothetical protein VDG1235_889 [Verrucomicrobiia bacterium DG1235]|nr:hypothetical protein VDG1235_889 [Verrucomicrobiae bacterium DG1235]
MKHAWNAQYRRWEGESVGVWQRRLSIARYGLRLCLAGRIIKIFLVLSLAQTLVLAGVFFLFGQLVAPDSALLGWLEALGGRQVSTMVSALTSWALLYPEICVDGIYRIMFFFLKFTNPTFSVIIVTLFVHRLIANDLASNAIVIYNSKALTRWDYLIGKFLVVSTILSVVWILPVVASWFLGNVLSPDWSFFYHSFPSLLRGLTLGVVAVVSISCLALLVSSLAKKTGAAVAYWMLGWLSLSVVAKVASLAHPVLNYISPLKAIYAFGSGVFRIADLAVDAQAMLPFFGGFLSRVSPVEEASEIPISNGEILMPLLALALYCGVSIVVVSRRVRAS